MSFTSYNFCCGLRYAIKFLILCGSLGEFLEHGRQLPPSTLFSFIAFIFCAPLNKDDSGLWCVFVEAVHVFPLFLSSFIRLFSLALFSSMFVCYGMSWRTDCCMLVMLLSWLTLFLAVWWLTSASAERWARVFFLGRHLLYVFAQKDGALEGNGVFIDWFGCWEALPWEPLPPSLPNFPSVCFFAFRPLSIGVFCLCCWAMPLVGDRGRNGLNLRIFLVSLSSPFFSWLGSKSGGALGLPSPSARACSESDLGPVSASSLLVFGGVLCLFSCWAPRECFGEVCLTEGAGGVVLA